MGIIPKGVPVATLPWARTVEQRLDRLTRFLDLGSGADVDRPVYVENDTGQNIRLGINGRVEPSGPSAVRFTSSTGQFEVTVSLAGLVRDGAVLGASFESDGQSYDVDNHIPKYGVVDQAPLGQLEWKPFAASYSTIISARPGVQEFKLYYYAECYVGEYSAAYVERARLSVKAV